MEPGSLAFSITTDAFTETFLVFKAFLVINFLPPKNVSNISMSS